MKLLIFKHLNDDDIIIENKVSYKITPIINEYVIEDGGNIGIYFLFSRTKVNEVIFITDDNREMEVKIDRIMLGLRGGSLKTIIIKK